MKIRTSIATLAAALLWAGTAFAACQPQPPQGTGGVMGGTVATSLATQTADAVAITGGCISGVTISGTNLQGLNILDNGDFEVDTRNGGAAVTANGSGGLTMGPDRFGIAFNGAGTGASLPTVQQTAPTSGLTLVTKSLLSTTGATATPTPIQPALYDIIQQVIFADNVTDLAFGGSSAQAVTFSAWMKSSIANAVVGVAIQNGTLGAATRSYVGRCQLGAAAAATLCSFTVPGDIAGTWASAPGSIWGTVSVMRSCGSNYQAAENAWASSGALCGTLQTQHAATAGSTLEISPIKLERGAGGTPGFVAEFNYQKLRKYVRSTFVYGTAPAAGIKAGMRCGPAVLSGTALSPTARGVLQFDFEPPMVTAPNVTTYSPLALTGAANKWADMTKMLDIDTIADPFASKSINGMAIATAALGTIAPGDLICGHAVFDTGY